MAWGLRHMTCGRKVPPNKRHNRLTQGLIIPASEVPRCRTAVTVFCMHHAGWQWCNKTVAQRQVACVSGRALQGAQHAQGGLDRAATTLTCKQLCQALVRQLLQRSLLSLHSSGWVLQASGRPSKRTGNCANTVKGGPLTLTDCVCPAFTRRLTQVPSAQLE